MLQPDRAISDAKALHPSRHPGRMRKPVAPVVPPFAFASLKGFFACAKKWYCITVGDLPSAYQVTKICCSLFFSIEWFKLPLTHRCLLVLPQTQQKNHGISGWKWFWWVTCRLRECSAVWPGQMHIQQLQSSQHLYEQQQRWSCPTTIEDMLSRSNP